MTPPDPTRLEMMAAQYESDAAASARYAIDGIPTGWGEYAIKGWVENAARLAGRALLLREAAQTLQTQAETIARLEGERDEARERAVDAETREHATDERYYKMLIRAQEAEARLGDGPDAK